MKFLVDAHLPPALGRLLEEARADAVHSGDLPLQNRTPDERINDLSAEEQRVVISKDTDFYYSHLLHQRPWKLVLVRTGNIGVRDLNALFTKHLSAILQALEESSLVELDRSQVHVVA